MDRHTALRYYNRHMEAQLYLQKSIRERLDELRSKNSQFSLRAFARLLGVSPASLSEFLNGKRTLSAKMLKKLGDKLCLAPEELDVLNEKIVREKKGLTHTPSNKKNVQLQNDQYYLVADWRYYAILCLAETPDFKEDYQWIAKRIKTSEAKVKEAMERLIRLGFLTYDDSGKLIYQDVEITTGEDVPSTSLKKRHMENLEAARDSLYTDDVLLRDMSFMTMALDPEQLPEIKKRIRKFQDELAELIDKGNKKEVYEICMQVFPRTDIKKDKIYEKFQ